MSRSSPSRPSNQGRVYPDGEQRTSHGGQDGPRPASYYVAPKDTSQDRNEIRLEELVRILRRRRRVLVTSAALVSLASMGLVGLQRLVHPVFEGSFELLVSDPVNTATSGSGGTAVAPLEVATIGAVALNRTQQDVPTLIRVLQSPMVLQPVFQHLRSRWPGLTEPDEPEIRVLQERDHRQRGAEPGNVLKVEARGGDREQLEVALQQAEKAYLSWSLAQRRERLQEAVRFLDQQAPELEAKASRVQDNLEDFRLRHRLLDPETESAATRQQVEVLRNQLIGQQAELGRLERLRKEVAAGRLVTRNFTSQLSDSERQDGNRTWSGTNVELTVPNQALLAELEKLDVELAAARSRYLPGTPILSQLEAARVVLVPRIQSKQLDAIDAALEQFRSRIRSTQSQINRLESRFGAQPALLRNFGNLEQQRKIAEGNLVGYLNAREQFQLEIAQNTVPWKVITPTEVSETPVEPNLSRGLLLSLLLGLVAGGGAAFVRDRFDHVFHSPADVRDEMEETLLGHVPYISLFEGVRAEKRFMLERLDQSDDSSTSHQRFLYQEAFRNLATSLRFLSSDQPLRSIALTSSVPAEGKSLVVVLLAKTLSELGQRVLLVDADMRKPQMHHRLGVNNLIGLSNLLTDEALDWRSCTQPVPNHRDWDVISAGRMPPDPPRLLSSRRMADLVQILANSGAYDMILYDTPPALGLADAALVAEQLDGLIMLVSLSRVDRRMPREATRRIRQAGVPVLGVVTNARKDRSEVTGASGYGYGYGGYGRYGFGYGASGYADDPALAYSYYQNKVAAQSDGGTRTRQAGAEPRPGLAGLGDLLKRWSRSTKRWLDGG